MSNPDYEVRDPEIERVSTEIGRMLKNVMPDGWGFTLLMFTYGADGSMFYISSAERSDMMRPMREFLQKFEAQ